MQTHQLLSQMHNSASNNPKIRIQAQHCWSCSGFTPLNTKQGFGLSNLPLSYAEHCPQMCIHSISLNSQLLLLSGNSHKVSSDGTEHSWEGQSLGTFVFPSRSGFVCMTKLNRVWVQNPNFWIIWEWNIKNSRGKKRDVFGAFAEREIILN